MTYVVSNATADLAAWLAEAGCQTAVLAAAPRGAKPAEHAFLHELSRFRRAAGVTAFVAVAVCTLPMAARLPARLAQDLAAARHVVAEGTSQNGCLRVRHAVMRLAAQSPSQENRP